jgi:hypothetical protein
MTVKFLIRDGVPFLVVVEREEAEKYAAVVGEQRVLVLPESGNGLMYARNWIKAHSIEAGAVRHWQLDDNIGQIRRLYGGERIPCAAGPALAAIEDFTDRYENIAISGFNYQMFVTPMSPPYRANVHVYSGTLINNETKHGWRLLYNDDTDICLQVLADGWCTVLVNVFMIDKKTTMTVKGGNTDGGGPINYQGDGRLRMARALEREWPKYVRVDYRWGRAQHVIDWTKFETELKRKPEVDLAALPRRDEYGMELKEVGPIQTEKLRSLLAEFYDSPL